MFKNKEVKVDTHWLWCITVVLVASPVIFFFDLGLLAIAEFLQLVSGGAIIAAIATITK